MPKIITYDFVKSTMKKKGYTLLSDSYINAHTSLQCLCPYDHIYEVTWGNWKAGNRCPYCATNAKLTIDFVKSSFESEGYILLTKKYKNNSQRLDYICPNGHKHSIAWKNWKYGNRCVFCDNRRIDYDIIEKAFKNDGYRLISTLYTNCKQKLLYRCQNGHINSMSWDNWKNGGNRCPTCNYIKRSGPGHSNWKGGISCEPYCDAWADKEYKESIKERDNYECQNPDCWKTSNRLTIHHIDYDKQNCVPWNLITVCNSCNARANKNRKQHKNFYEGIIKNKSHMVYYETN